MAAAKPNTHGYRSVNSGWNHGDLEFRDASANPIIRLDATNRLLHTAAVVTAPAAAQNITPTAAQILGGVIEHSTQTANGTCTLDTAAHIDAAIAGVGNNDCFDCVLANTGSTYSSTITTAAGLTLKGTVAVPAGKNGLMTFVRTGAAAWTVYCSVSA